MQTLPDSFYALMHMLSGRALHYVTLAWSPALSARLVTQGRRYLIVFIGLLNSCGAMALLLWSFSPAEIYLGLNELWNVGWFLGLMAWMSVTLHILIIGVMLIAIVAFYRNPSIRQASAEHLHSN